MSKVTKTLDKALNRLKVKDSSSYSKYERAIIDEDYRTASLLFRQAEQDDLTDAEVDKLLKLFVKRFNKRPA